MSAIDDIRVLLGEHGVKCEIHDTKKRKDTLWDFRESSHAMFSEYRDGMTVFVMSGSLWTPAQAIAATVGRGTCHMETADGCQNWNSCSECGADYYTDQPINYCPNCGRRVVAE